jgi:ribosomal protein S18 acetylase RimI-like enzyme
MPSPIAGDASDRQVFRRVAELHVSCIDQGFLSTLGPRVLALMYEAIDEADGSVLILSRNGDAIVGFVSGTTSMRNVYLRMIAKWPRLLCAIAPALLSITQLKRMMETVRHSAAGERSQEGAQAELLSIAVEASERGSGRAESLYSALCAHFRARGIARFRIVVGSRLARAHRFYSKMGAKPLAEVEVHKGDTSIVYVHDCAP